MLNLSTTSDKISVVTSSAADIDVQVSYADFNLGASQLGRKNTAIASATTTDITGSPASGWQRNIKHMSVRNKHASTSQTLTFTHFDGTNTVEIYSCVLLAGQILGYDGEDGWKVYGNGTLTLSAQTGLNLDAIPALGLRGLARFAILNNGGQYGLLMGVRSSTGYAWLQAQRVDGTAAAYGLMLNPNGGGVLVGDVLNVGDTTVPTAPSLPTGGTVTTLGTYTVHTFLANANFVVPAGLVLVDAEMLLVAGGGGGGGGTGGGGGAGGFLPVPSKLFLPGTYPVVIGAGGAGSGPGVAGVNGGNSTAAGLTAIGGGGGGPNSGSGVAGGSGGGGSTGGPAGGAGTAGQGNAGGQALGTAYPNNGAAGGGGAGAVGQDGSNTSGGNGGDGLQSSISGSATYYAGGGGGGSYLGGSGLGGNGGGGNNGANATANTGGGGGGQRDNVGTPGGNGGSGIVIIRYRTPAVDKLRVSYDAATYLRVRVNGIGQVEVTAVGAIPHFLFTMNGDTRVLRLTGSRAEFSLPVQKAVYTVSTLPTGALGDCAMVSDASSPTFGATVAGGGSTKVPVYSDGTNWKVG